MRELQILKPELFPFQTVLPSFKVLEDTSRPGTEQSQRGQEDHASVPSQAWLI